MSGSTTKGVMTILHPVKDLAKAKVVYTALLGMEPQADSPYYVGYEAEGQQTHQRAAPRLRRADPMPLGRPTARPTRN